MKIVVENALKGIGFRDVRRSDAEVAGAKNDVVVASAHFHINGPDFHEVVIATGDTPDATRGTHNEVISKLRSLVFFD